MNEAFSTHGAFSWNELMTTDVAAAKAFYGELLGWAYKDMPEMSYSVVSCAGNQMAGITKVPPQAAGAPPAWGAYITVTDVDATAQKATSLGATVLVAPQDIPGVGRFCWIKDPQGAAVAFITYERPAAGA